MNKSIIRTLFASIFLVTLSAACTILGGDEPTVEPPAGSMLPDLPGYNTVEGQKLTDYIATLSGGAALLTGQPELALAIASVDQMVDCYQGVGAVRARLYSSQQQPLSAGTVAIADRNALLDPANLFRCVLFRPQAAASELVIEPCTASYTLERGDDTFYIIYAGSTADICHAFCTELEGCTAH